MAFPVQSPSDLIGLAADLPRTSERDLFTC
jgi:hypothetical protein